MKGGICRRWVVWMGGGIDVGISERYDGRMDVGWMTLGRVGGWLGLSRGGG